MSEDLFSHARKDQIAREAPLAARLRPRTLDEFVGQRHILGPGRLLRRAIQADQLSSLVFYGPPGTGKTTLAMVIANTTRSRFITINAVLAGVKEIREVTAEAQEKRTLYGQRTILFVDEVHRWNKAQQDALLPWVENGTIVMIGATTENPWFSVNRALLSRSRVFQLVRLDEEDLREVARHALADEERGYGRLNVELRSDALEHLVSVANGDARSLLNALELAIETTEPNAEGLVVIDLTVAEESIQQRAVLYDQEGDYHFDTISAFIKSLRGSDPDAALYWLAKMVYAGEDPRFIFRRMLILASEDVGLADPQALGVVESAASAFDRVGLPEGRFFLTQAALYLANAAKSNSALAFFDALSLVEHEREGEVPTPLKDSSRDKEGFGHGEGYLYPHAYRDHWVAQQYLPESLQGKVFYHPSDQGYERQLKERVERRREAQLAAMVEGSATFEVLTHSPGDRARDRWLERAVSDSGRLLGEVRDRVLEPVSLRRHDLVLDLNAGSGLLTWEALRRVPEGGVWSLSWDARTAQALEEQSARLPELERPHVLQGDLADLAQALDAGGWGDVRFDLIVGRNALGRRPDKAAEARRLAALLQPEGVISLAEAVPARSQRLYELLDATELDPRLATALREAEEAAYRGGQDPADNWGENDLIAAFEAAGLVATSAVHELRRDVLVTEDLLARWFGREGEQADYARRLARLLSHEQVAQVRALFRRQLGGKTTAWRTSMAFVVARAGRS
ncbi:MAG: AAA family ATPase [Anaerolineae bacterium]